MQHSRPAKPSVPGDLAVPGLIFRLRQRGWVLSWAPRSDLQARGCPVKTVRLWPSDSTPAEQSEPTREEWIYISNLCAQLYKKQLGWAHGGVEDDPKSLFDGTVGALIEIYQKHKRSPFQELRYGTQRNQVLTLKDLKTDVGKVRVAHIAFDDLAAWQDRFAAHPDGGPPMKTRAATMTTMLRRIFIFGSLVLSDPNCDKVCAIFEKMAKAQLMNTSSRRRTQYMTAAQCRLIRAKAHEMGLHSIALAQAFQFELGLRQKDVIGEWIPRAWPGVTDVFWGPRKWLVGIRWDEIDASLILRHRLSKSLHGKKAVTDTDVGQTKAWDLREYPMIMEEFQWIIDRAGAQSATIQDGSIATAAATFASARTTESIRAHVAAASQPTKTNLTMNMTIRSLLPTSGPLIIGDRNRMHGRPWVTNQFALTWRKVARAAGVPDDIQNRDSRPGAATEADVAGAPREKIQRQLGHAKGETTGIYLREDVEINRELARLRVEKRKP